MTNAQLERMQEYGMPILGVGDCHWRLHHPQIGLRFRPTAQNRKEYQQASGKTVRFSDRLDRSLLRVVLMDIAQRKPGLPYDWDAQGQTRRRSVLRGYRGRSRALR